MKYNVGYSIVNWQTRKTEHHEVFVEARDANNAVRQVLINTNGAAFDFCVNMVN